MGLKIIKDATCDRCGRKCSHISERTYKQISNEAADCNLKHIESFHFHFTELELSFCDDRFPRESSAKIILCGECTELFSVWLKDKENELP